MTSWTDDELDRVGNAEELQLASRRRIRAGGVERDVTFEAAASDVHPAIDGAYHAKYDRYGPAIVGTVVGPAAVPVTIRLVPTYGARTTTRASASSTGPSTPGSTSSTPPTSTRRASPRSSSEKR